MNPVMLDFELNNEDREQIKTLKQNLRTPHSDKKEKDKAILDFFENIRIIYSKAHERALKYYPSHVDEILPNLKQEIIR